MAGTQQVTIVTTTASSSPIAGTASPLNTESSVFTPQLGRDMYITLKPDGSFNGSVQVQRSTDNGLTWSNITVAGGQPWGLYTGACDEVVETPTDGASRYRLKFNISGGTIAYRLAQ